MPGSFGFEGIVLTAPVDCVIADHADLHGEAGEVPPSPEPVRGGVPADTAAQCPGQCQDPHVPLPGSHCHAAACLGRWDAGRPNGPL